MIKQTWRDRLIDPRFPDRRPRRAAYALPTLFTAGNVFLGFYALIESFQGSMAMVSDAATAQQDRKSTRLNSSHANISYAVFCLKKKKKHLAGTRRVAGDYSRLR